uniref:G_PROTEIN_RECEP_F1_2 domain-containing protein n=1 Tax=Bursaphelenchus xylophilus TaxID=6326 RepID=A0A1I7SUU9_BURXY
MDDLNPKYPAILLACFAAFGIFGNLNIIAATVRRRSLRTTCNQLIAISAFFDLIHVSSQHIMTYFVFSGNYPTLENCFYIQLIPMVGCNAGEILMFFTSLDRLYCVAKPVAYQRISAVTELAVCVIGALLFAGWLNYETYLSVQPIKEKRTLCSLVSSYNGPILEWFPAANGILNFITMLNYVWIWIIVKKITKKQASSMLRSIAAVTFCVVGGWLLTFSVFAFCVAIGVKITDEFLLYAGLPLNLSVSLNYPLYFVMSSQYRLAFKQQLNILSGNRVYKGIGQDTSNIASNTKPTANQIATKKPRICFSKERWSKY